jgi:cellulose synthase/poly-beta-1,6-N-acetylglucosamine synthase-like glycosyltransferase
MTHSTDGLVYTPAVQLFILSRDRLDFCRETVASAVAQTYKNCQIIVSDNSEKDDVSEMLAREFPSVVVIRRKPSLPALNHFNKLIGEAAAPLMVLFHDDDVLEPEYVAKMVALFLKSPEVGAIGCNAQILMDLTPTGMPFMGAFRGIVMMRHSFDLLEPYLSISLCSPAPFPGYMYRTSIIKGLGLDAVHGGKHADVSFLVKVLKRRPILWTDECLFKYRFHGQNDSSNESVADRLSWLRYTYATNEIHPKSREVRDYKFLYWIKWIQQNSQQHVTAMNISNRRRIALRFVRYWTLRMAMTRLDFWKRTWRRLKPKIRALRSTSNQ